MKTKLQLLASAFMLVFGMNAQVTITGSGTGGWNQPGGWVLTNTPAGSTTWVGTNFPIGADKNMKFSEEGTWATTGGFTAASAPGFPSGVVQINGGSNIVATGGTWANPLNEGYWNVTYDTATKAYSFTEGINPNKIYTVSGAGISSPATLVTTNGSAYSKKSVYFSGGTVGFNEVVSPINPTPSALTWGGPFPTDGGAVSTTELITVPTGIYNIYFTRITGLPVEYSFEPTLISMMGNFAGSGWGADIDLTTTDGTTYTKLNHTFATTGTDTKISLKFRDNHDWSTNFGVAPGTPFNTLSGTAVPDGPDEINIEFDPGVYDVSFNRNTLAFSFTPVLATNTFSTRNFNVSPNPTNNYWKFTTNNNEQISSIQVIDMLGKVVSTVTPNSGSASVDASNLNTGIYFAKVASENGVATVKLVKN